MSDYAVYIGGQPFARVNDLATAEGYAEIWRVSLEWEGDQREVTVRPVADLGETSR